MKHLALAAMAVCVVGPAAFSQEEDAPKPVIVRVPKNKPGGQVEPVRPPPLQPDVPPARPDRPVNKPADPSAPPQNPPRVDPSPGGAPASPKDVAAGRVFDGRVVTDRVMKRTLGSEKFQQMVQQLQNVDPAGGVGAPSASVFWDRAERIKGGEPAVQPQGTPYFSGQIRKTTVEDAQRTINTYGSIPGGVVLEGVAAGVGEVSDLWYDSRYNALILNGAIAYFLKVPPRTFAVACRAIAQDEKGLIGVSLGDKQIVYGKVPESSDLAWDLKLADHFLGDIVFVFGRDRWTAGYKFAKGYTPERFEGKASSNAAVFFQFNGFKFGFEQEQMRVTGANFDVRLIPLSDTPGPDGGLMPDPAAIARNDLPKAWERNARHLSENIAYYAQERIVDRVFGAGEAAALVRELKRQGFNMEALALSIEGGKR
ncbi:MAG TPA: hypothetical protein VF950_01125 [Planctomycetota bacterium]